ncbi:MAG: imidazole glycerol phosphate synthase subunit HisF [Desulforegulaceae bacterium]|nr:imidazole glycerol phosphate synthase subunit HisF [Desulforegulaceae bacterium]
MITILDYGAGNVRSIINAVKQFQSDIKIVKTPSDILSADKLIFPGVGNFESMIKILDEKNYIEPLKEFIRSGKPFFGICLGLHALLDESEESPHKKGLGIIKGKVKKFNTELSIPHMGWNGLNIQKDSFIFSELNKNDKFYFVHSYHASPENSSDILTTTNYGYEFTSAIQKDNIIATQFHPEKSGHAGLKIIENFISDKKIFSFFNTPTKGKGFAKRIIACLDVRSNDQGDLIVTKGDQYDVREKGDVRNLGKPVELAKRYYNEGADEITFLNITGFRDFPLKDLPMIEVLKKTSENVFVPLTIGGGIRDFTDKDNNFYSSLEVASQYFRSGADKISIGSDAVIIAEEYLKTKNKTGKSSIEQISAVYGSQAVVISIDPKKVYVNSPEDAKKHQVIKSDEKGPNGEEYCWYQCTVKGGREGRDIDAPTLAKICQELGAGEILVNSIDKDGTNSGFDINLINLVKKKVSIPVIASSGAGKVEHFEEVFSKTKVEAGLAAGIFHRKEVEIEDVKKHLEKTGVEVRKIY